MTSHVHILSTGGTIASTSTGAGKTPTVSANDLIDAVPTIADVAPIDVEDVISLSGFQIDFSAINAVADAVERVAAGRCDGVVITHGTDTMAETAFAIALTVDVDLPVVFTGAQRSFDDPGTDGPVNIDTAIRVCASKSFQSTGGCYIAFNDRVHLAEKVVKAHSSNLDGFESPDTGPIAERIGDTIEPIAALDSTRPIYPGRRLPTDVTIPIVINAAGAEGSCIDVGRDTVPDGIVVAGTGLGNVTDALAEVLLEWIDRNVPVVLTTRCHAGSVNGTYGGPGGAKTLLDGGAVAGGHLPAWKARIALSLALADDNVRSSDIEALFDEVG